MLLQVSRNKIRSSNFLRQAEVFEKFVEQSCMSNVTLMHAIFSEAGREGYKHSEKAVMELWSAHR